MADLLTPNPNRPLDWAGDVVPGAKATFYASGTTTPLTVYQDAAGTIPHAQPILANGNGAFPAVYCNAAAKAIITTPDNEVLPGFPLDPVPRNLTDVSGASLIPFAATSEIPATNVQAAIEQVQEDLAAGIGSGQGIVVMNAGGGGIRRTITGSALLTVANGNGVAGNPTLTPVTATEAEAQAGAVEKLMTALRVEQHMLANAIGWGQTWQDVSGSRTHSTYYTNSTGRPIMVSLRAAEASGARNVQLSPDGSTVINIGTFQTNPEAYQFIVPPTWQYRISGSCTITIWSELR